MAPPTEAGRTAADGSPYPDRAGPAFERDVRRMFTHIAKHYEGFDHVASLGGDFLWRPRAMWDLDRFRSGPPVRRVLDLGCGTGELARVVGRHFPEATVVASDFTVAMLRKAEERLGTSNGGARFAFARATAQRLPFADGSFDLTTNAFVARNLSDLAGALREMRRILRPGGTLLMLEITEPNSPRFGRVFHAYFDRVVPMLGAAIASEGPYRYLPESLRTLPPRDQMLDLLRASGYSRAVARPQSMGIVTTFLAEAGPPSDRSR